MPIRKVCPFVKCDSHLPATFFSLKAYHTTIYTLQQCIYLTPREVLRIIHASKCIYLRDFLSFIHHVCLSLPSTFPPSIPVSPRLTGGPEAPGGATHRNGPRGGLLLLKVLQYPSRHRGPQLQQVGGAPRFFGGGWGGERDNFGMPPAKQERGQT